MPSLPVLDNIRADDCMSAGKDVALPKTYFKLSQLDLDSISIAKTSGGKKRAAAAILDDDEDLTEEAQMMQLLQQMQRVKQSNAIKRRKSEITAKSKVVAAGVRRIVAKRIQETKANHDQQAAEIRSTMDSLGEALEEESNLAHARLEENSEAMKKAANFLAEKIDEAVKVQERAMLVRNIMRQSFQDVRRHAAAQVDIKIVQTEEEIRAIQNQPDRILSLINGTSSLA